MELFPEMAAVRLSCETAVVREVVSFNEEKVQPERPGGLLSEGPGKGAVKHTTVDPPLHHYGSPVSSPLFPLLGDCG